MVFCVLCTRVLHEGASDNWLVFVFCVCEECMRVSDKWFVFCVLCLFGMHGRQIAFVFVGVWLHGDGVLCFVYAWNA